MALGLKVTEEQAAKRVTRPGRHAQNLELVEGPANAVKNAVTRHTWIDAFRFAKLVGIQRQYALDHIEYDRYVHPLVGEAASVEIRKRDAKIGPRRYWRMEFNKAQALELKRRIDEQERDFANGREIARTVNRCPAWVSHIFHEKGEKRGDRRVLKISVGEETRNVSVYSLGRKGDKFRITLMKRDHLQLFAAWTREKGNTQTWNPAEKSEIPEGWVTTTVAGRALGFATPDVSVRNRIESAVIANWQRLRDGRIVVLETEIMKLKRRKDESTQKTIKLRRFCKRELGMTDHQVDGSVRKDILSNQIFVMKKLDGTDATVPVSKDFDGELTVSNADAKELKKIHKKREAGLIDREEAARILEVSQGTIIRYTDQKTETVGLILEDGTTYTIQAVLEGSEYRFVRNDVTAAKRAGDSAKQKFVGAEHIAGRTGLRIETIRRIFAENDHVFETKKEDGRTVRIEIIFGKENKLLVPKRCAGELATLMANGDYIPVGFNAKLYGKECERAQPVQMEPFFAKFPELREAVVFDPVNQRNLLPLFIDHNIALPLATNGDGTLTAAAGDRILVEMYARLFCKPNYDAIRFAETLLRVLKIWDAVHLSETQIAALYTLRQFTNWLKLEKAGDQAREFLLKLEKRPFSILLEAEMPEASRYYDFALQRLVEPVPPRHFWPE